MSAAPTLTEVLLDQLTAERDAMEAPAAEPKRLHVTLELDIPAGVTAEEYRQALVDAHEAFRTRNIAPRVWRVSMGPTRLLPRVTVEGRR